MGAALKPAAAVRCEAAHAMPHEGLSRVTNEGAVTPVRETSLPGSERSGDDLSRQGRVTWLWSCSLWSSHSPISSKAATTINNKNQKDHKLKMAPRTQGGDDAKIAKSSSSDSAPTVLALEASASLRRRVLSGEENAKVDTTQVSASVDMKSSDDTALRRRVLNGKESTKVDSVQAPALNDEPPYIPKIKGLEASTGGSANAAFETVEPSPDVPWYDLRTPLDSGTVNVDSGIAAQPWTDMPTSLTLEAEKPVRLAAGAGQKLEALAGSDQLHLLVGGSLLLVAGVVVSFMRRARKRNAAEKALEDETYYLMAQP